jgi:dTMP kinase
MQNKSNYPKFIVFEGIDGSGKSTQMKLLAQRMEAGNYPVFKTFEPTDSPIGRIIRTIFNHQMAADHRTIAGLFLADRLHHLLESEHGVLAKLDQGYHVLCDRYYFSSYAYHAVHMPMQWVIDANAMAAEIRRPDLTIFIDVMPEISIQRLQHSRENIELYETLENLQQVRTQYFLAFDLLKDIENIEIIDGHQSTEIVHENIWLAVSKLL